MTDIIWEQKFNQMSCLLTQKEHDLFDKSRAYLHQFCLDSLDKIIEQKNLKWTIVNVAKDASSYYRQIKQRHMCDYNVYFVNETTGEYKRLEITVFRYSY